MFLSTGWLWKQPVPNMGTFYQYGPAFLASRKTVMQHLLLEKPSLNHKMLDGIKSSLLVQTKSALVTFYQFARL